MLVYALETDDLETAETLGDVTRYSTPWIFLGLLVISVFTFNRGGSLYSLWHLMTWFQFMRWIPVIDTNQHGLYNAYFSKVAASLDAYEFITYGNDQILDTERFEMMSNDNLGIQSSLFVNNAEETIAYWLLCLILVFVVSVLGVGQTTTLFGLAKSKIKYNCIIRASLVLYFDFVLFAVLQLKFFDMSGVYEGTNSIVALFVLFFAGIMIFIIPIVIKIRTDNLHDKDNYSKQIESIDTLITEFSSEKLNGKYNYLSLFMVSRFVSAFILVFLTEYPMIQLLIMGSFVTINMFYVFLWGPFKTQPENNISGLAELCTLLLIIQTGLFQVDSLQESTKQYLSWGSIGVVYVGIVLCLIRYFGILGSSKLAVIDERQMEETIEKSVDIKTAKSENLRISNIDEPEIIKSNVPIHARVNTMSSENTRLSPQIIPEIIQTPIQVLPDINNEKNKPNLFDKAIDEPQGNSSPRKYGEGIPFYARLEDKFTKYNP